MLVVEIFPPRRRNLNVKHAGAVDSGAASAEFDEWVAVVNATD